VALSNQCTFPIEVEPANPGRSRRSQGRVLLKPNSSVNLLNTSEKRVP
jgi:hypothetical protein